MNKRWMSMALCLGCWHATALEINQASEAELDGLRGIGPPFTRRLLAAREQALFVNWQDLRARVKGMGPKLSQSLSDQGLTVNGQTYGADAPVQPFTR
jgi:competence protein ComEA